MHKSEVWALLADAARARVLRQPARMADMAGKPLQTIFEASAERLPLHEIMSNAPGRSFASTGARRSALECHSDPVREDAQRFARSILTDLDDRLARKEFAQLVVHAPPQMLGLLRDAMPEQLAAVVTAEIQGHHQASRT